MSQGATTTTVLDFIFSELIDLGVEKELIRAEARFDELDIDSLDVADLMTSVKRDYRVTIPRRDLVGITLEQLAERVVAEKTT